MEYIKRGFILTTLFLVSLFVFCGCGASIDTKMDVNKDFKGTRVITVTIEKSDLDEYVTGGMEALKQVADASIPKDMSYSVSDTEETQVMTFKIEFQDIDDYVQKVTSIISAGSNQELKPEVQYENMDTVFKKGVYFFENFTSKDLLQWYFDALSETEIVSETDQSNWASLGDSECIIAGKEYEVSSELYVDARDHCCLDKFEVETTLHMDGTITRQFRIGAYGSTIEKLQERDCVFGDYVKELVPDGATLETEENVDDQDDYEGYVITVKAKSVEELIETTDQILQSKNGFSMEIKDNEEASSGAKVYITEKLDGTYYLDYRTGNALMSVINMYPNSSIASESSSIDYDEVYFYEDRLTYYPSNTGVQEFVFDWEIGYASVELDVNIKNRGRKIDVNFIFTPEKALQEELQQKAIKALKEACGTYGEFKESGGKCTISFTGTVQEVCENINALLKMNDVQSDSETNYFSINIFAAEMPNKLFNSYNAEITYDLSPVIGRQSVTLRNVDSFYKKIYYNNNLDQDAEGNSVTAAEATVTITQTKLSIVTLAVCVVGVLCVLLGSLMLVFNMKKIKKNLAEKRELRMQQQDLNATTRELERNEQQSEQSLAESESMEDELL